MQKILSLLKKSNYTELNENSILIVLLVGGFIMHMSSLLNAGRYTVVPALQSNLWYNQYCYNWKYDNALLEPVYCSNNPKYWTPPFGPFEIR